MSDSSAIPQTIAYQAALSMGFSRQKYWSGLPFPSPGNLPNPGIKPTSPELQVDSFTTEPPGKPLGRDTGSFNIILASLVNGTITEL